MPTRLFKAINLCSERLHVTTSFYFVIALAEMLSQEAALLPLSGALPSFDVHN